MTVPKDILPLCVPFRQAIAVWDYQSYAVGILDLPPVGTDRHFVTHNALGLPWLPEPGLGKATGPWKLGQALQKAAGAQGTQMSRMPPLSLLRISTSVPPDPGCFMSNSCILEFGGSSATRAVFCWPYVTNGVVINSDSWTGPQVYWAWVSQSWGLGICSPFLDKLYCPWPSFPILLEDKDHMRFLLKLQIPAPHPGTTDSGFPERRGLGIGSMELSVTENLRSWGQGCLLETIRGRKPRPIVTLKDFASVN